MQAECIDCGNRVFTKSGICSGCEIERNWKPTTEFVIRYSTLLTQMRFRRRFEIFVQSAKNAKIRCYQEYRQLDSEKLPVSPMFNKCVLFDWDEFV